MNEYQKANLFVGRYRTGVLRNVGDHIGLPDAKVRLIRGVDMEDGWHSRPDGDLWLMVEHGNFWPVMVRLDDDEIAELRAALVGTVVQWTYTTATPETITTVVPA